MSNEIEGRELIVKINHSLYDPDLGVVDILFVSYDNGQRIELPSRDEFPTKGIFISKQFENISRQFKEGELFFLKKWEESRQQWDENNTGSGNSHHPHWAYGTDVKQIPSSSFIPIFEGTLPNIATGEIEIPDLPVVSKPFFIQESNDIYGPFTTTKQDDEIKAIPYDQPILNITNKFILKVGNKILENSNIVTEKFDISGRRYIKSLHLLVEIASNDKEEVDFISDDQLITNFSRPKFGKKGILGKKEAEKLRQGIQDAIKEKKLNDDTNRVSRLTEILDHYLEKTDFGHSIINDYFNSEKGKTFLEGYLENKDNSSSPPVLESAELKQAIEVQGDLLQNLKNQVTAQQQRVDAVKKDTIKKVIEAQQQAEKDIAAIKEKSKEQLEKEKQKSLKELQSDIIELENKKDKINEYITSFYAEREDIKNFLKVEEETKYLEVHADKLKEAVKTQQRLLSSPDLGGKMTEVKTVLDMLQGRSLDQNKENYPFEPPKVTTTVPDQADQYIQTLVEFFDEEDHSITFEEVTNLLINIQQSFLTVLAGLPGTGKTSSVMRLSAAQYLCSKESSNSDCFLNVPVARGWVSSRDFVGFNNSLKGVFQPAKTGIYQFLRQGEQADSDKFLRMILLDEANLSPIEHYWSEFLAMCDKEGRNRPLDTGIAGKKRYLDVAKNIRFIATINNDNTTEPLSPRLCDRVPVISMGSPSLESSIQQIVPLSLNGAIEYDLLEQWFGIPVDNDFSTPPLIETFCEKMQKKEADLGAEINISPRKKNAMTAYYEKAKDYIDSTLAIDFALSQHALPLINGHGQDFKKRLEGLESWAKSSNLTRTASLLQDILKAGEMYVDSYSFF